MAVFTNQATLSYNNTVTNSNIAVGTLVEALTAAKTAVTDTYTPGDDVTYVVSLINNGRAPLQNLTLRDDLGGYTFNGSTRYPLRYKEDSLRYYVNGVLQDDSPAVNPGPPMVISRVTVPPRSSVLLIYEAEVTNAAPLACEGAITNTVTVTGRGITCPVTASETITVEDTPRLSISKSMSPSVVMENGQLTYTFLIQNTGNVPVTAADDVVLTDDFDPMLEDLTVTFNGEIWNRGANYTYTTRSCGECNRMGRFATIPGQITVPAATFAQDPTTGVWTATPGVATLVVSGRV